LTPKYLSRTPLLASLCAAALITGCGASRTPAPNINAPAKALGPEKYSYPAQGISFNAPRNWSVGPGIAPQVAEAASGLAKAAIWRYPRTEPLPASASALDQARMELVKAARSRDPHLRVIRAVVTSFDGHGAIELAALEHVSGRINRVRSVHVFAYSAEIVLDEYAPETMFHAVDRTVFSPLKRSLRISRASGH
jgi:hypothetical protein